MPDIAETISAENVGFSSRLNDDIWSEQSEVGAFESWRFDAVSDDGREALVITFYDNFPFSARYIENSRNGNSITPKRFPAVSFVYSVDGKAILRAINEFKNGEFSAESDIVGCTIGKSSFRVDTASYGTGFMVEIDVMTARKRRIVAELEWLSVESDLLHEGESSESTALFNMVAPRSDVSGRISLIGRRGRTRRLVHFRGTGSHEHFRCQAPMRSNLRSEYIGCAHFIDSTAIFYNRDSFDGKNSGSKLFIVRDGALLERDATPDVQNLVRNIYGLKIPRRLSFTTGDNVRLRVKPVKLIRSGFCEVDMISEMTLMLRDGKPRKTLGITEFIEPRHAKRRLFRWLSDLRIGKNGKPPLF